MWCWRRMKKIMWSAKITNEDVLRIVGEERTLLNTILKRKGNWIGPILQKECLLHDVVESKIKGLKG